MCGGDVMQRDDDTPDAINRRLDLYEEQTSPLIEHYEKLGRLVVVDGVGTPDGVFTLLTAAVERVAEGLIGCGSCRPDAITTSRRCARPVVWSPRCTRRSVKRCDRA